MTWHYSITDPADFATGTIESALTSQAQQDGQQVVGIHEQSGVNLPSILLNISPRTITASRDTTPGPNHQNGRVWGRGGFTLTELLVTMGVTATLMAIAIPSIRGAYRTAQDTTCMANQNSAYKNLVMLVEDYSYGQGSFKAPMTRAESEAFEEKFVEKYLNKTHPDAFLGEYGFNRIDLLNCPTIKEGKTTSSFQASAILTEPDKGFILSYGIDIEALIPGTNEYENGRPVVSDMFTLPIRDNQKTVPGERHLVQQETSEDWNEEDFDYHFASTQEMILYRGANRPPLRGPEVTRVTNRFHWDKDGWMPQGVSTYADGSSAFQTLKEAWARNRRF